MSRRDKKRGPAPARPRAAPEPRIDAALLRLDGPLRAVAITLALLLLARAVFPFLPGMWAWSLNLHRFVAPWIGWSGWLLAALALVPPVGKRLAPIGERIGQAIEKRPAGAAAVAALLGALLAWIFPDHVRFVGDFLLRQGTVEIADKPSLLFPQALPLDVLLHYVLPTWVVSTAWIDANGAARVMGALEAAMLAAFAVGFARATAARGGGLLAVAATVFFGGYLGMFTGFSKAFAELSVLVACVATFGARVIREGRGLLGLGIALAVGVTLHRSALGLIPAVAFAWIAWLRNQGRGGWKRPEHLLAAAIPLAALVVMVPRIVAVIARWDTVHFVPQAGSGGVLPAALAGTRPLDLVNLVVLIAPLAAIVPVLAVALGRRAYAGVGYEALFLWLLALPFLVVMPIIHPVQGLVRDWDDFAATGVALSVLAAWYLAQAMRGSHRAGWIAAAITLSAAAPAVEWLAHNADLERGLLRVRALVLEPPARAPAERGHTWDYLGIRYFRLNRFDEAAEALSHAAETSPSPRILQQWALSETMRRNFGVAMRLHQRMLEKSPENPLGWLGLASTAVGAGDLKEGERAARELLRLEPGNVDAFRVLEEIARRRAAGDTLVAPAPAPPPAPGAAPAPSPAPSSGGN